VASTFEAGYLNLRTHTQSKTYYFSPAKIVARTGLKVMLYLYCLSFSYFLFLSTCHSFVLSINYHLQVFSFEFNNKWSYSSMSSYHHRQHREIYIFILLQEIRGVHEKYFGRFLCNVTA